MNNFDRFEKWLLSHTKAGYEAYIQICPLKNSTRYIGFHIPYAPVDRYNGKKSIVIHGILCDEYGSFSDRGWTYYADITYCPTTNVANLVDNRVDKDKHRQGIGSLGLTYIKNILQDFGCKELSGHKNPIPNTPEEMAKLTAFYVKNGFENLPGDNILYKF